MIEFTIFPVYVSEGVLKVHAGLAVKGGGILEDAEIVDLYWERDERAISESDAKYGVYCYTVANNILWNQEDSKECLNDTWVKAWNAIPPQRPLALKPFFAKIIRNLALNRYHMQNAQKRGGNMVLIAMEELNECVSSKEDVESAYFAKVLQKDVNLFLHTLPERDCDIFLRRYFFLENTAEIARRYGMRDSNVLVILSRLRKKLKKYLRKEGYSV